jgi:hypothetical protein
MASWDHGSGHSTVKATANNLRAALSWSIRQARRSPMLLMLRRLVHWEPLQAPAPGYTVVIACMRTLPEVLLANLRALERCDFAAAREIVLVFDCAPAEVPEAVRQAVTRLTGRVPTRILGYDKRQLGVARTIDWGWVYAWLSWCIGIGAARTGRVLLHDLDALILDPQAFDHAHARAEKERLHFLGVRYYEGNGVTLAMGLPATFELSLDAAWLRANFRPFDVFNRLRVIDGNLIDFDTMLWVERQSPARAVMPIRESQLLHPSQMICNYTDLRCGRATVRERPHSLLMLPWFVHLGGSSEPLRLAGEQLAVRETGAVPMFGLQAPIVHLPPEHFAWTEKQIRRGEQALFGGTRPEVAAYLRGIVSRAGDHRTVGREPLAEGGVPDA